MHPEILKIGAFTIHGYGLMIAIGIVLSFIVVIRTANRLGRPDIDRHVISFFFTVAIAAYVGGKGAFLLSDPSHASHLYRARGLPGILSEGFVFHGAVVVAVPALILLLRRLRMPVLATLDIIALSAPILHGTGRIGCFLAGCCHGCRTDAFFAVVPPEGSAMAGIPIHPAQLYEAAACAAILVFLIRRIHRPHVAGTVLASYLMLSGAFRFLNEFLRGDQNPVWIGSPTANPGDAPSGITQGQVVSLAFIAAGIGLWMIARRLGAETATGAQDDSRRTARGPR